MDAGEKKYPKGMRIAEFFVVISIIACLLALLLPALARSRGSGHHRPSCQNHLKQWALVFKMYGNESKGELWPPMQRQVDEENPRFMFSPDVNCIYPEYFTDPAIAVCPSSANASIDDLKDSQGNYAVHLPKNKGGKLERMDDSYVYWGWAFDKLGDESAKISIGKNAGLHVGIPPHTVVPMQLKYALDTGNLDEDFKIPSKDSEVFGNASGDTVYRLREGVERFLMTDTNDPKVSAKVQSILPIMHDLFYLSKDSKDGWVTNHIPAGMNVLYLDGHVDYLRYETPEFSELFSDAYLSSLAGALTY